MATPTISFGYPLVGATTPIQVSFSASMEIAEGDTVSLTLTGFTCEEGKGCSGAIPFNVSSVPPTYFEFASWSPAAERLTLTAAADIPPGSLARVSLSRLGGLQVAPDGLVRNDPSLLIASNAGGRPSPCDPHHDLAPDRVVLPRARSTSSRPRGIRSSLAGRSRSRSRWG